MKKEHKGMIDNRHVSENHQEGIRRVLQRKGDMEVGQGGKMEKSPREKANWRRPEHGATTPRRA